MQMNPVGDYFNAGDYEVQVTELEPGSGNGIWTGKGYTTVAIKGGIEADVAVQFTNISLNACYQLTSGESNFVEAQPDPTWSNVVQPSKFMEMVGDFFQDLAKAVETFTGQPRWTECSISSADFKISRCVSRCYNGIRE